MALHSLYVLNFAGCVVDDLLSPSMNSRMPASALIRLVSGYL